MNRFAVTVYAVNGLLFYPVSRSDHFADSRCQLRYSEISECFVRCDAAPIGEILPDSFVLRHFLFLHLFCLRFNYTLSLSVCQHFFIKNSCFSKELSKRQVVIIQCMFGVFRQFRRFLLFFFRRQLQLVDVNFIERAPFSVFVFVLF